MMNPIGIPGVDADVTQLRVDPDIEVDALIAAEPGHVVEVVCWPAFPRMSGNLVRVWRDRLPLLGWALAGGEVVPVALTDGQVAVFSRSLVLREIADGSSYSHPDVWADLDDATGTWTWRIVQGGAS